MAKMKQTDYAIVLEPLNEADGGGWLASVPALPGCMGDGETPEEAVADARAAMAEWKDAARQLGQAIPSPAATAQCLQRVPRTLHYNLKRASARAGLSLYAFVRNALAETVGRTVA